MSIQILPPEVLERILLSSNLTHKDIINFSLTCKRFQMCSDSNEIWRELYSKEIFDALNLNDTEEEIDWKQQFILYTQTSRLVEEKVTSLSSKFYNRSELSFCDLKEFDDLLLKRNPSKDFTHLYILHSLRSKLNDKNSNTDLTNKYYGRKVVSHVHHRLLTSDVKQFVQDTNSETDEQNSYEMYEKVLVMLASWCQPEKQITYQSVENSLDSLANKILELLQLKNIVDRNKIQCLQDLRKLDKTPEFEAIVLDVTNEFLVTEGFDGNKENYYLPDNSYINRVLETKLGIPISLSLMYLCLVGRIGVNVEPVNFPRHFLLRWRQYPTRTGNKQFTYIDVFKKGARMQESETSELLPPVGIALEPDYFHVATPRQTAQRMLRNLIAIGSSSSHTSRDSNYTLLRSTLELMLLVVNRGAEMSDMGFMLIRIYLQLNINHEEVERMCEEWQSVPGITDQVEYLRLHSQAQKEALQQIDTEITPKKRINEEFPHGNIRFQVGSVTRHKKYKYICVVYGWDKKCTASQTWIRQMKVDQLPRKETQPFYNVLVMDGSNRYAADENLEPCDPIPITHPEIGKYFKEFDEERGYIPNDELIKEYPDDRLV